MRLGIFLGLLTLAFPTLTMGQTPAYLHYTIRDGLPGNLVHCGLQDRRGLLWFGTDKGLACFDGMRFRLYGVQEGLPDPEVLNMHEDSLGRLWLFCFRQKPCYLLKGRIITEKEDSLLAKLDFKTGTYLITEKGKNDLWLTELTRKAYHSNNKEVRTFEFPHEVTSFHNIDGDDLIVGLNGLMQFKPDGRVEMLHKMKNTLGYQAFGVSGNYILYTYTNKTVLLEWQNGAVINMQERQSPTGQVCIDRQDRFWVCSPAEGAILFPDIRRGLVDPQVYLPGKKVLKMFEDREGTFWFCTADEGIYALRRNAALWYRKESGINAPNIRSIARDQTGQIFVGNDNGTIYRIKGGKVVQTIVSGASDGYNQIRQIIPAGLEACWYISDEGLGYADRQYKRLRTTIDRISMKGILARGDTVYFASATHTGFWEPRSGRNILDTIRSTAIGQDAGGTIWIGKVDGLYSLTRGLGYNWGNRYPDLKSRIVKIQSAGPNELWVVTADKGLLQVAVKNGDVTGVVVCNGRKWPASILNIQDLFVEPDGKIWMATNKGVYSWATDGRLSHFSTHDGLADDDVNAVLVHRDTLWAGTVSGLTSLVLKTPVEKGLFRTHFSQMHYLSGSQSHTHFLLDSIFGKRTVVLPPDMTNLELDLAGLTFRSRGNLHFEIIKIERLLPMRWWTVDNLFNWIIGGFTGKSDKTLVSGGTFNLGTYLPAGNYSISATAIQANGIRSAFPDSWSLVKRPYWYQTVWLYLLVWGVVSYVVWRVYRDRLAFREMQAAAATLQLQALQAQMNPHFIGNTVNAIQQFLHPPDPEKTSEYIALFMRLLRRTMQYSEEAFIPFEQELQYIREYLQLVELRFGEKFRYEIIGAETIPLNTPFPSMLLQPILENATMHGIAPEGVSLLQLSFVYSQNRITCVLKDNGIGILEAQRRKEVSGFGHNSKGLALLEKKIHSLNKLYKIDLDMHILDIAHAGTRQSGTQITIQYRPH